MSLGTEMIERKENAVPGAEGTTGTATGAETTGTATGAETTGTAAGAETTGTATGAGTIGAATGAGTTGPVTGAGMIGAATGAGTTGPVTGAGPTATAALTTAVATLISMAAAGTGMPRRPSWLGRLTLAAAQLIPARGTLARGWPSKVMEGLPAVP